MCEACRDQPDPNLARCNRPDGFSTTEANKRNRTRNLNNASGSIARGDFQAAANSLNLAAHAQTQLNGGPVTPETDPAETAGPSRDFIVNPADLAAAEGRLEQLNVDRKKVGRPELSIEVTKQYAPDPKDPIYTWERNTIRVSGATEDELGRLSVGSVREHGERKVNTFAVLEAAVAANRLNGGEYIASSTGDDRAVPAQVRAFLNDSPGGPVRRRLTPTTEDRQTAKLVRGWIRTQSPTNEYAAALRHSVSENSMSVREAGTAASGLRGYLQHQHRLAEQRAAAATAQPTRPGRALSGPALSPRPQGSRWLARPQDHVTITARVVGLEEVETPGRWPKIRHTMVTPDGDVVSWLAPNDKGIDVGEDITVQGQIKAHSFAPNGEKQTELFWCKEPAIHSPQG